MATYGSSVIVPLGLFYSREISDVDHSRKELLSIKRLFVFLTAGIISVVVLLLEILFAYKLFFPGSAKIARLAAWPRYGIFKTTLVKGAPKVGLAQVAMFESQLRKQPNNPY